MRSVGERLREWERSLSGLELACALTHLDNYANASDAGSDSYGILE